MAGPGSTRYRYDVFLSHSSADKPVVRDLADRVEDLTKTFSCSIALTADALEELPASMVVKVLELIDADGADGPGDAEDQGGGHAARLATLEQFEQGVEDFHAGRLAAAAEAFAAVLRQDPDDSVAAEFLRRCTRD